MTAFNTSGCRLRQVGGLKVINLLQFDDKHWRH